MQFSVIIPTKDRPTLLGRALRSALTQQGIGFDIIVADDGDGCGAAVARALHDPRITAFTTSGRGQVQARIMAAARATGAAIAYLDDDDWWESATHLAALGRALAGGGLAYASGRIVHEDDSEGAGALDFTAHIDPVSIRTDNLLLVSGIAYDRHLHAALGPLDAAFPVYWDWDWYLRLAAAGTRFTPSHESGVRISARADTVSAPAKSAVRQAELERLCAKHGLVGIVLRNHQSIAADQDAERRSSDRPTEREP